MELTMFFEFPGILITIGVILLLISIIIIIIAYKTESKVVDASKLNANAIPINPVPVNNGEQIPNPESTPEKEEIDKTKVFNPIELNTEKNLEEKPEMGILDKIEGANHEKQKEEKPEDKKSTEEQKEENKEIPSIDLPKIDESETIDAFDEEFENEKEEENKKPEFKMAEPDDIIDPRKDAVKDKQEETIIEKPEVIDEDDVELL